MQYVIDRSWLIVESPGRNPDWLRVSKSFYISSNISFSNNLPQIGSIDNFFLGWRLSFLCTGRTFAFFHKEGYLPDSRHFSYTKQRGSATVRSQIFSIAMDKPSHPCAFFESKERISDKTFYLSIPTLDKILSHVGVNAGIELSSGSREHCLAKNLLKTSAFVW